MPAYVPGGYTLEQIGVMGYLDDRFRTDGIGTFARYVFDENFLEVQQSLLYGTHIRTSSFGGAEVQDVIVNGNAGVWLTGLRYGMSEGQTCDSCQCSSFQWSRITEISLSTLPTHYDKIILNKP